MTTQTKIHISERFFTKAKRYFGSLESALNEALQNAYRATLPRLRGGEVCEIKVRWDSMTKSLQIRDFGVGITDIGAALSIGVSNWGKGVEEEQDPAGMGLCGVMAFCERIVFRSQFGRLEFATKSFFENPIYRGSVLDVIDSSAVLSGDGTEITMVGVNGGQHNNDVYTALHNAARFHTAIRITFAEDAKEPAVIKNFLEIENWKLRETPYRGYKVYHYEGHGHFSVNGHRDQLLVVWHGQCIKVPLEYVQTKIRLPEVPEPVETSLKLPDFETLAIVIDYGAAPVTPKLPDRDALIMDAKTLEFIAGLFLPEFERRIEVVRAGMIKAAEALKNGKREEREAAIFQLVQCSRWNRAYAERESRLCVQLTSPLFTVLYNHYIGLARVQTMAPESLDDGCDGRYCVDLVPFDRLPSVLSDRVVLWSDTDKVGRVLQCSNENVNRLIIKEYSSYEESRIDWSERDTACENGFEVFPGVCTEIDVAVGAWSPNYDHIKLKKTTVVVHTKKTAKELGWADRDYTAGPFVDITAGPVKLTLVTYDEDSKIDEDISDYSQRDLPGASDFVGPTSLGELIASGTHLKVPCVMMRLDEDMEPQGSVFAGSLDDVMHLTHVAGSFECNGDRSRSDMSTEEWEEYVTETWDDFRSKFSGVPELSGTIDELVNKIRVRAQGGEDRARIISLSINLDKNVITFKTAKGKPVKTRYR